MRALFPRWRRRFVWAQSRDSMFSALRTTQSKAMVITNHLDQHHSTSCVLLDLVIIDSLLITSIA